MSKSRKESYFWTSYSDLMTSMFFVMLVLFVLGMLIAQQSNINLQKTLVELEDALNNANARKEQLEQILQLETQFEELGRSSALEYIEDRKMFVAKDFVGIEIFYSNDDIIKEEYVATVDSVGLQLLQVVKKLHTANPNIDFQLVIEGNAAIPWQKLRAGEYNKDDMEMYKLSYRRALALYQRWKIKGIDLRGYNTEVIISGSGFNGINRDMQKEDNNKRFIIQIIPKVARPDFNTN